jgi:hypothetical protein
MTEYGAQLWEYKVAYQGRAGIACHVIVTHAVWTHISCVEWQPNNVESNPARPQAGCRECVRVPVHYQQTVRVHWYTMSKQSGYTGTL